MKRVRTHIFILLMLLCGALMLGNVTFAKYQTETPRTLTATLQSRWTPAVERVADTTSGLVATFRVKNTSTTAKTLAFRLQTNETIERTTDLFVGCKVGSGDYVTVNHLTLLNETINTTDYCAMDDKNREMTWTLAPGEAAEVTITGKDEKGVQNSIQLIAHVCGQ